MRKIRWFTFFLFFFFFQLSHINTTRYNLVNIYYFMILFIRLVVDTCCLLFVFSFLCSSKQSLYVTIWLLLFLWVVIVRCISLFVCWLGCSRQFFKKRSENNFMFGFDIVNFDYFDISIQYGRDLHTWIQQELGCSRNFTWQVTNCCTNGFARLDCKNIKNVAKIVRTIQLFSFFWKPNAAIVLIASNSSWKFGYFQCDCHVDLFCYAWRATSNRL